MTMPTRSLFLVVTVTFAIACTKPDQAVVMVLTKGKSEDMVSFKDKLTHDEMKAVAAYIRSFVK